MKKVIRLSESDLSKIVNRVISENEDKTSEFIKDVKRALTQRVSVTTVGKKDWEHSTVKKSLPQLIKDIENIIQEYK
jgi:hypothetical protein